MTRRPTFILASMIALLSMYWTPSLAKAQAPPFNGGGVVGFDPEISVVNTGALMDAQVVVSDDRRYVTINARPSQSRLIALNVFQTQAALLQGGGAAGGGAGPGGTSAGFVGGAGFLDYVDELADVNARLSAAEKANPASAKDNPSGKTHPGAQAPRGPTDHVKTSPSEILKTDTTAASSFLRKEGMFLLTPASSARS